MSAAGSPGHALGVATTGTVRLWHDAEGWGVVDAEQTPGGCWVHFSAVAVAGYRSLSPGQAVVLEWEAADQDGFAHRAVRTWPAGSDPVDVAPSAGEGYASGLTFTWDEDR